VLGELLAKEIEANTNLKVDDGFISPAAIFATGAGCGASMGMWIHGNALTAILKQPVDPTRHTFCHWRRLVWSHTASVGAPLDLRTLSMVIRRGCAALPAVHFESGGAVCSAMAGLRGDRI